MTAKQLLDHCNALREASDHLAAGRLAAGIARLDGAVAELRRLAEAQGRDERARLRAEYLRQKRQANQ